MSAEDAFLASLGAGTSSEPVTVAPPTDGDEDDYDPSAPAAATPSGQSNTVESTPAPATQDVLSAPLPQTSRASSAQPPKQITIGGFVTEESDEEADEAQNPEAAQTNGSLAIESVQSPAQAVSGFLPNTPVPPAQSPQPPPRENDVSSLVPNADGTALASASHTPIPPESSSEGAVAASVGEVVPAQPAPVPSQSTAAPSAVSSLPKTRLPNDIIGQFEDRIAEDSKGDVEAWMGLIAHLKSKGKFDEVRKVYGRFFEVFPTAADQWVTYARMELEMDDLPRLEAIFNLSLLKVQSIPLWSIYLDHVRRRNDIATDASGQGRQVVSQAYEFVINQVGQDKDSGSIWQDYIAFVKSGPGIAGGSGWQDAQKMDLLRKAYQRAICVPMSAVSTLWKEYDTFEMGLNKMTGRKFLQEKSPSYMTARSSFTALQNVTRDLRRGVIPRLPPLPGFEGEEDYLGQVDLWQKWIAWEKEDPLVLKEEDASALQQRILFVYRQAAMTLRFWPPLWYDAAKWCFDNGLDTDGDGFLDQGLEANPESCLLAFSKADRIERMTPAESGDESMIKRGSAVRAPYDSVIDVLYKHLDTLTGREKVDIARIEEKYEALAAVSREQSPEPLNGHHVDEDGDSLKPLTSKEQKEKEIDARKATGSIQTRLVMRTLTLGWVALMRAMRRIQGKGKPNDPVGGMRGVFKQARSRGRWTSDLFIATALLEHNCYRDQAAPRIFNLRKTLFPDDEVFALEHIKFLISIGDVTNARAEFETTVSRITTNPQNVPRARVLFAYFHDWESKYGELAQASKIEKRVEELYPGESPQTLFTSRFGISNIGLEPFDPCAVRLVLSPTQVRPKSVVQTIVPSIETIDATGALQTGYVQSPKRPLEDSDAELPARKLIRGESPLKGAAGRRQQQRQAERSGLAHQTLAPTGPKPLPQAVVSLLSIIPPARQWDQTRFDPHKITDLIRAVDLTKARIPQAAGQQYGYGYGR